MRKLPFFPIFLLCAAGASASEGPEQVVRNYLEGYSDGIEASELVRTFWLPSVIVYAAGIQADQIPAPEFASRLDAFRKQVRGQGFLRTVVVESKECLVREDLAMVSVRYMRQFDDGTESMNGVLYTLSEMNGWKISSVMPTDAKLIVGCLDRD